MDVGIGVSQLVWERTVPILIHSQQAMYSFLESAHEKQPLYQAIRYRTHPNPEYGIPALDRDDTVLALHNLLEYIFDDRYNENVLSGLLALFPIDMIYEAVGKCEKTRANEPTRKEQKKQITTHTYPLNVATEFEGKSAVRYSHERFRRLLNESRAFHVERDHKTVWTWVHCAPNARKMLFEYMVDRHMVSNFTRAYMRELTYTWRNAVHIIHLFQRYPQFVYSTLVEGMDANASITPTHMGAWALLVIMAQEDADTQCAWKENLEWSLFQATERMFQQYKTYNRDFPVGMGQLEYTYVFAKLTGQDDSKVITTTTWHTGDPVGRLTPVFNNRARECVTIETMLEMVQRVRTFHQKTLYCVNTWKWMAERDMQSETLSDTESPIIATILRVCTRIAKHIEENALDSFLRHHLVITSMRPVTTDDIRHVVAQHNPETPFEELECAVDLLLDQTEASENVRGLWKNLKMQRFHGVRICDREARRQQLKRRRDVYRAITGHPPIKKVARCLFM